MRKHFALHVTEDSFAWERQQDSIEAEARLDGLYAIRTSLPDLAAEAAVEAYKSLSGVERAFRTSKDHLRVRPIHVYSENHVRGHVFLCMFAYYVEWHMRRRLAPLLFQDDDLVAVRARRDTPVEPTEVSDRAKDKADTKTTPEVEPEEYRPIYGAYMRNDKRVIERLEQYGAAIPRKHRENLRRGQALMDIMASQPVEEIPDGMDVEEWEARQALKFYDAFRESHADTPDIVAMLDAMAEYRRNNPRPKEMGGDEWQALQIQAAADQVYGPQGAFNPDGTKR